MTDTDRLTGLAVVIVSVVRELTTAGYGDDAAVTAVDSLLRAKALPDSGTETFFS